MSGIIPRPVDENNDGTPKVQDRPRVVASRRRNESDEHRTSRLQQQRDRQRQLKSRKPQEQR